jgi:cardiolipin synthase A/B
MWMWVYVASGWAVALVMLPLLARRYDASKAWAWLVILLAFPVLGLVFFTMFADNPFGRLRRRRYALEVLEGRRRLAPIRPFIVRQPTRDQLWGIDRLTQNVGGLEPVAGNDAQVMADEQEMMDRLIADIDTAARHVHVTMYIFADDSTGRRVAAALAAAAQRGVQVRVLADAVGSWGLFKRLAPWMLEQGVDVRPALPVNALRRRIFRFDIRNHRKLVVIDGTIGHIGSRNLIDPDYGRKDLGPFRELMVRCVGPIVRQLQLSFLEDWHLETDQTLDDPTVFPAPPPEGQGPHVMQALPSGPMYPSAPVRDVAVAAIHAAHDRVILTTPYLVPDDASMLALRLAAGRGVRVDVVASYKSDAPLAAAAGRACFGTLLEGGVNVYLHRYRLVHTKALTIDNSLAMIGSANFDHRSFRLNMETNLLVYSQPLVAQIAAVQERYIRVSDKLDYQKWCSRAWHACLLDDLAKMIGPII